MTLKVEGVDNEINTVKCINLSAASFLANNDLNITASCIHVNFAADDLFTIDASPCFWRFVFQKHTNGVIQTINTSS